MKLRFCSLLPVIMTAGVAPASIPTLPCTSNESMISAVRQALGDGKLNGARSYLADDVAYGSFRGRDNVIAAYNSVGDDQGPAKLVFATESIAYFAKPSVGISERVVSLTCKGDAYAEAPITSIHSHRRNEWIETVSAQQQSTKLIEDDR